MERETAQQTSALKQIIVHYLYSRKTDHWPEIKGKSVAKKGDDGWLVKPSKTTKRRQPKKKINRKTSSGHFLSLVWVPIRSLPTCFPWAKKCGQLEEKKSLPRLMRIFPLYEDCDQTMNATTTILSSSMPLREIIGLVQCRVVVSKTLTIYCRFTSKQ